MLFRDWTRVFVRQWRRFVSPVEMVILLTVQDRTYSWGREWCYISYRYFADGTDDENPAGKSLARSTVAVAIARLVKEKFLLSQRDKKRGGVQYALNSDWRTQVLAVPQKERERFIGMKLAEPKSKIPVRLTDSPRPIPGLPPSDSRTQGDTFGMTDKENGIKERDKRKRSSFDSIAETVKARNDGKRKTKHESLSQTAVLKGSNIQTLWNLADANQSLFSDWSVKEKAAMKKTLARWKCHHGKVLSWCVENWSVVIGRDFAWMTNPPETPSVLFFVKWEERFRLAYQRRRQAAVDAGLSTRDRKRKRLMQKGATEEDADRELDERSGVAAERHALEQERLKLQRERLRLAEISAAAVFTRTRKLVQPVASKKGPMKSKPFKPVKFNAYS